MALRTGARLGPYEILAPLGAGGMGEVYRARDTRLGRDVAIKVLPSELSASPRLRQRLEREARAVSSLSHSHICTLYDIGREGEADFLVMEYLEGETLADRLGKGRLPLDQTLRYASEIADALDAAHRHGVIHRDLKPGNVMLTKSGAKLLDFGLAKLRETGADEDAESVSRMPTLDRPLTDEGTIVGTYPYMAPEQLEGQAADARTDLFAFGAMLYEMVTGQRAFQGESRASLIAAIMASQPRPISDLQPMTPPLLDRVVGRCLEKDRDERWQSAGDLAAELQWIGDGLRETAKLSEPSAQLRKRRHLAWALSVVAAAALGILVASWWQAGQRSDSSVPATPPAPVSYAVVELPPDAPLALDRAVSHGGVDSLVLALSPDGSQLAYVGDSGDGRKLYLRRMDSFDVAPIPGTEDAIHAFFSPDGVWLGFLTTDKVKKVSLRGGAPVTLCEARGPLRASWTRDDLIYFTEGWGTRLSRVPAAGGQPVDVLISAPGRISQVLPDGGSALFTSEEGGIGLDQADIHVMSLESRETRLLIKSGYDARYVPSGHLLFARSGSLLAIAFDLERLEVSGEPVPVVSDVSMDSLFGQAQAVVSDNGSLVYAHGRDRAKGKLAWVDRQGKTELLPVPERLYGTVDLAPGGKRLAVHVADVNDYIWIYDVDRDEGRRLAAEGADGWPVWTPDAKSVAVLSWRSGERRMLKRAVDGSHPPVELSEEPPRRPLSWSPDGEVLATPGLRFVRVDGRPGPEWPVPDGSYWIMPAFSPDGRWVAYASDETGRFEIWVRSYPDGETARQISVAGGLEPVWCEECDELFYRRGDQWFSSAVTLEPELAWEPPRLVFETDFIDTQGRSYDVTPDGQRLLVVKSTQEARWTKLRVIQNWFEGLGTRMREANPAGQQDSR